VSFLAGGCCGGVGLLSPASCYQEHDGGCGSVGRAGMSLWIGLTPAPAFSVGIPWSSPGALPGMGGVSPAVCNPLTWRHWLDPALKDTSAAGGSVQSGTWPSLWWSLLGSGVCLPWAPSEPVSSSLWRCGWEIPSPFGAAQGWRLGLCACVHAFRR